MIRRITFLVTAVLVVGVLLSGAGIAVSAASASDAGSDVTAPVTPSENTETESTGDGFGTNVSVSEEFETAEREFRTADGALENASGSLLETADTIESANAYRDADHDRAMDNIDEIEANLETLETAETDARNELVAADLNSAERFLVLESIDEERNSTEATVDSAFEQYESAVRAQQSSVRSTVLVHFGGALLAGLLGGAILGAVVPLLEARNVRDQMKLSRNVSYNRRAGLVPIVAGFALFVCAVGLLWYLGIADLIGVIV